MLDRCDPARRLFVAVPAYTGSVSTETAAALVAAVPFLERAGVQVTAHFRNGNCYLDAARNQCVADFLESDATDMLFVDADVGFTPEAMLRIAAAERPVVGGAYPYKDDSCLRFPVRFAAGEDRWADEGGLLECIHVPTGFLRLNRAVFDHLPAQEYIDYGSGPEPRRVRDYFRCTIRDTYFGEDVEFCRRWREAGGKVRMIPDLTFTHFGMKSWMGNWGEAAKAGLA